MTEETTVYKIRGTKVISPYPVNLTPAETRLVFGLQKIFNPENILVDSYFPKPDSKLSSHCVKEHVVSNAELLQIDCLAIDERGIFVFESKGHLGWIYGHGNRIHWTQVSAYGKNKHQFYNPVRQNASHIDAITCIFGSPVPIYNIIVFGGDVVLKVIEDIPPDCYICTQAQLSTTLRSITSPRTPFSTQQVQDICAKLKSSRINPNAIVRENHISEAEIAKNHSSTSSKV